MKLLTPYAAWIKLGVFVAICSGCYVYGGSNAKARAERECLAKENKALATAVGERDKALERANRAQREADRLASLPPKIVERVRANPSGCKLARPVTDSVREQVRATNDAIRSVP